MESTDDASVPSASLRYFPRCQTSVPFSLSFSSPCPYLRHGLTANPAPIEQVLAVAHDAWKRNRKEHPPCWTSHGQHKEPSWQHYIFGARIPGCYRLHCSICACDRGHHGVLSLEDDKRDNAQPHEVLRRRRRRREVADREIGLWG